MPWDDAKQEAAERRARNQATGRKARAKGDRFEAVVAAKHAWYAAEGRALVYKRPTPIKPIGPASKGAFRAVWQEKAGCDYGGAVAGGRAVLLEVKGSSSASLPLDRGARGPTLAPLQADELDLADRLGAIAGVLVAVSPAAGVRWFFLPWRRWCVAVEEARATERASLGVELLERHGFAVPPGDWLAAVDGGEA